MRIPSDIFKPAFRECQLKKKQMKNLSLFSLLLMAGMLLFLSGCQRDDLNFNIENQHLIDSQNPDELLPLDSFPDVSRFLQKKLKQIKGRNAIFTEQDIDKSRVLIVEYPNQLTTYSMIIKTDTTDNKVFNVIIEQKDSAFTNIKVVSAEYYTRNVFSHSQYAFSELFGGGARNLSISECIKQYYFVNEFVPPGTPGQGGGMDEIGTPNGPPNPPKPNWPDIGTGGTVIGSGNINGGGSISITSNCTGCTGTLIVFPCNNGICCSCIKINYIYALHDAQNGSRDLSEDCKTLLQVYGFLNEDFTIRTDEVIRECRNANPAVKAYLDEIKESYINPCTGKPAVDVNNLEAKMCFLDKYNLEDVKKEVDDALEGVDYIVETELKENCPELYCLYNKMIQSNNNFICKYVTPTFDSDKFKLSFKVGETGAGSSAHVTYDKNSKSSTLTISPTLCDKDKSQVTLMGIMLHEFVHTELARKMSLKGYNINDINDLYKFYPKLAEYIYDVAATQGQGQIHHNIMLQYENIIDKMALALYQMFDGAANGLSIDHFKMTAANGLFEAMEKNAATNSEFSNLYHEFRTKYEQKGADMQAKNLKLKGCG